MSENEEANSHQQRLVEHIDKQRMSAEEVEKIHPLPEKILPAEMLYNSPKEISEDKNKNPRDYREVVGRAKAAVRKAEERNVFELIKKVGQIEQLDVEKADIPLGDTVENREAEQRKPCAEERIELVKDSPERGGNHH